MHDDSYGRILHDRLTSQKIKVRSGKRQGCASSPLLFNIVLNTITIAATRGIDDIALRLRTSTMKIISELVWSLEEDIANRLKKARQAFAALRDVYKSWQI